jgi:solute carrier organic anion transporter family protein 1B
MITVPTMAIGMFLGGYIIKKLKLTVIGIGKFSFLTSSVSLLLYVSYYALICENKSIAGLTMTYDGFVFITISIA